MPLRLTEAEVSKHPLFGVSIRRVSAIDPGLLIRRCKPELDGARVNTEAGSVTIG